jgi:hypothetical protein
MQSCPNCHKEGIKNLDQLRVGPDRKIECSFCKNEFSVKKSTWLFLLFFVALNIVSSFFLDYKYDILFFLSNVSLFCFIKMKYIKLYNVNDIWN